MRDVVNEGTGTAAALAGIEVAGKTGTAETGVEGVNTAWFIAFAPADDPRIAVATVLEGSAGTGGVVAAPVARDVIEAYLSSGVANSAQ
jgi:penicillin-binding protein A